MIRLGGVGAFSYEQEDQERVGLLVEVSRDAFRAQTEESAVLTPEELAACIRQAVFAAHDLNLHSVDLICAGTLPKTSSGKVQRHAARQAFLSGKLASVQ
jgi:acyl-CoA synthetase (AMP-forming)/AMP-acid ligase II